ncbi:MAG: hypothetical protein K2O97_09510, partial [Acetatifactor sp.]|nr:hypothetical protein [Acetatifactor sp.]
AKVFIRGRASVEEDRDGKLICEQIVNFDEAAAANGQSIFQNRRWNGGNYSHGYGNGNMGDQKRNSVREGGVQPEPAAGRDSAATAIRQGKMPRGIWLQFPDADSYFAREKELLSAIADSDGNDDVVIFLKSTRGIKVLPPNRRVCADEGLREKLGTLFGAENVKIR